MRFPADQNRIAEEGARRGNWPEGSARRATNCRVGFAVDATLLSAAGGWFLRFIGLREGWMLIIEWKVFNWIRGITYCARSIQFIRCVNF